MNTVILHGLDRDKIESLPISHGRVYGFTDLGDEPNPFNKGFFNAVESADTILIANNCLNTRYGRAAKFISVLAEKELIAFDDHYQPVSSTENVDDMIKQVLMEQFDELFNNALTPIAA